MSYLTIQCLSFLFPALATATSKSLQSCPTLSDPMDFSLLGSSVHGIFQARVLEWGAIAFSVLCPVYYHIPLAIVDLGYFEMWYTFCFNFLFSKLAHSLDTVESNSSSLWSQLYDSWKYREECERRWWENRTITIQTA